MNIKKIKKYGIFSLIIIIIILGMVLYSNLSVKQEVELLSNTIEEKVFKILEISTAEYNYTNVVTYKDNKKVSGLNVPFTNKSFLIKYNGYIKAGVDLDTVETQVKDIKTVKITLDKPIILENVIVEEDVYIYDEKDSVFNKLSFDDLYEVLVKEKKSMEEEVIEKGLLNDAENNTKEVFNSLLQGMGFENIEVVFK